MYDSWSCLCTVIGTHGCVERAPRNMFTRSHDMKMQGQRPYDDKNLPNGSKIQMYVSVEKERRLELSRVRSQAEGQSSNYQM